MKGERIRIVNDRRWLNLGRSEFELPESAEIIRTEEYIRKHCNYAGVLPMTADGMKIMLGGHDTQRGMLWGPFAGKIELGESIETAALREGKEETGHNFDNLLPPTVILNVTRRGRMGIGAIFPTILPEDVEFTPTEEIQEFRWMHQGDLMRILDNELDVGQDYELWGSNYTYPTLELWLSCLRRSAIVSDPAGSVPAMMNRIISFGTHFGIGDSAYEELKRKGELP